MLLIITQNSKYSNIHVVIDGTIKCRLNLNIVCNNSICLDSQTPCLIEQHHFSASYINEENDVSKKVQVGKAIYEDILIIRDGMEYY